MKTVIVSGGNRGIGFEICRQLDGLGFRVIMCSRIIENGVTAAQPLSKNVVVKQLDVTNDKSIMRLFEYVKQEIGCIDILINNAGIGEHFQTKSTVNSFKKTIQTNFNSIYKIVKTANPLLKKIGLLPQEKNAASVSLVDVKTIMETNFYGAWKMTQVFIPLLKENSQIINVSSGMGQLDSLTGYYPGYSMSKASLNALTIMFSKELEKKGIKVNAICPGWVKTDMGGPNAPRSLIEGADTVVWLSTLNEIPSGKFFRDRKEINW
jgi:NAD(P)-dependent dehydrogenase (short-subunit alcohol dehydrogenase family)